MTNAPDSASQASAPGPSDNASTPDNGVALDIPPDSVVLLEDRAQVERRRKVFLPAGNLLVSVDDVSPLIVDRTLQCRVISPASGARVVHAVVRRNAIMAMDSLPERVAEIQKQLDDQRKKLREQQDRLDNIRLGRKLLDSIAQQGLDDISTDVAWGRSDPALWSQQLATTWNRDEGLRQRLLEAREVARELEQDIRDLELQRQLLESPSARLSATLEIQLEIPVPGEHEIILKYLLPSACWRPWHSALLNHDAQRTDTSLEFSTTACVWQKTGEDWNGVKLRFSTERSTLGSEPPLLRDDLLRTRQRQGPTRLETRDEEIWTTGLGGAATRQADDLPGIDDAGEPVLLEARGRYNLPSDGRPFRVPVSSFHAPASMDLLVMAERVEAAIARCEASNQASTPILAGPVDLITRHGLAGRSQVRYTAPGERFELGFGPDAAIRVRRSHRQVERRTRTMSRWETTRHTVSIRISNVGSRPRSLLVRARIPVSEVEQARVTLEQETTPPVAPPDSNGMLRWEPLLPPGGTLEITLVYSVSIQKDAVMV